MAAIVGRRTLRLGPSPAMADDALCRSVLARPRALLLR